MTSRPICIIPARGGSKRIPRKNIKDFNGKPLIAWSIETALASDVFSEIIVSTDDAEIAEVAKQHGASVPFMRDASLSDDFATTAEVIADTLMKVEPLDHACCLYPTAPLLKADDFQKAFLQLTGQQADCVISVTEFDFHPLRAFTDNGNDKIGFKWPEHALTRSQDLPDFLHDAGAFYFFKTTAFKEQQKLVMGNTLGYKLERNRAVDIDTPEDFEFAKLLHMQMSKV